MGNPTTTSEGIQEQIQLNRNAVREQIALISAATRNESQFGYEFAYPQMTSSFDALHRFIAESHDRLGLGIIRHAEERMAAVEARMPRQSPPHIR